MPQSPYQIIGTNIKRIRTRQGITQEQMAETMGITKNYYGQFERGEKVQSLGRLFEICRILSAPIESLFEGSYSLTEFINAPSSDDYPTLFLDVIRGRSDECKDAMLEACRIIARLDK